MKIHNKSSHAFQHSYFNEKMNLVIVEIQAGEIKEVQDNIAQIWLKTGQVVEFVAPEDLKEKEAKLQKQIEELQKENEKLKTKELDIKALKKEADKLGISYNKNIGAEKLLARINEYKENN